jgi:hypothetical protein
MARKKRLHTAFEIELDWQRDADGYEFIVDQTTAEGEPTKPPVRLERRGGAWLPYSARNFDQRLYEEMANMFVFVDDAGEMLATPQLKDGAIAFTAKWGLPHAADEQWCDYGLFLKNTRSIANVLALIELRDFRTIEQLMKPSKIGDISVRLDINGCPVWVPKNLLSFAWLQLVKIAVEGVEIRRCEVCKKFMTIGIEHTDARRTCSDACRQRKKRATITRKAEATK